MSDHAAIQKELMSRLQELRNRVTRIEDRLSIPGDPDWEEKATQTEDNEVLDQIGEAADVEIAQIEEALQRLQTGEYGKCSACGRKISAERLDALPYTTKCMGCA